MKTTFWQKIQIVSLSMLTSFVAVYIYITYIFTPTYPAESNDSALVTQVSDSNTTEDNYDEIITSLEKLPNEDFVNASRISTKSVVYIKNISERRYATSWMDMLFGNEGQTRNQVSTGSGVIYSKNGYVITNNHVIEDADKIEVNHNKNTYTAKLIGTDPSTDLALLKVEAKGLPAIPIGSSKALNVGEWVIAVGNPFNLTSTVTAGIVSAKGRDIDILRGKFSLESFIQTDAAINPGNSGGALVNKNGELVGINTAILSRTGSYAGYGFAVPVDIVKKIVNDLIEYGEVQKAFFGAEVVNLNQKLVERYDLNIDKSDLSGVVIAYIQGFGAASKIDLKEGDVLLKIDNETINSKSQFDEIIGYHSPGDQITITYKRNNKINIKKLTLTNREGTTSILKREVYSSELLGADFESLSKIDLEQHGIDNGVKVFNIKKGLINDIGLHENYIIVRINRNPVKNPEKLTNILEKIRGRVLIEGINRHGRRENFSFYLR